MFGRDFMIHPSSAINEGIIEVQFDYNCAKINYIAVADMHGYFPEKDLDLLFKFLPLFNAVVVHY